MASLRYKLKGTISSQSIIICNTDIFIIDYPHVNPTTERY